MAKRPYFIIKKTFPFFDEHSADFKYEPGFALVQSRKNITNLHNAIQQTEINCNILEVSTKSDDDLGVMLSAFNLQYTNTNYKLENVFQASKVFSKGGPYRELLSMSPSEAKRNDLLHTSGSIIAFEDLENNRWSLEPKTAYYDWIYIKSALCFLNRNPIQKERLLKYSVFTDIAFNPQKSINCQARSLAMLVGLIAGNAEEKYLRDQESFLQLYASSDNSKKVSTKQISLFDIL